MQQEEKDHHHDDEEYDAEVSRTPLTVSKRGGEGGMVIEKERTFRCSISTIIIIIYGTRTGASDKLVLVVVERSSHHMIIMRSKMMVLNEMKILLPSFNKSDVRRFDHRDDHHDG